MPDYIPRHSRLTIKHRGVRVINLSMESGQAADLIRVIQRAREDSRVNSDADIVELIISSIMHELMQGGV
jgi:hypothetical protein